MIFVALVASSAVRRPIGSISSRDARFEAELIEAPLAERFDKAALHYFEKRKGGGGSGGGGGRSGGSSGSGGSSSGGGGRTGNAGDTSPARPSYGGGRYYGGGATTAYRSGGRSPGAGIAPYFLASALIFPGIWLYGAYAYNYNHPYNFHNRTNTTDTPNGSNQTLPVTCLCDQYSACGCDDNNNSTYLDNILGDGTPASQNSSLVHVGDVNGTKTIVLNGTLPNGTDTTASADDSTSAASKRILLEMSGFWVVGAIVGATVWIL